MTNLEQAEARLAAVRQHRRATAPPEVVRASSAWWSESDDALVNAAIEVGRLRALAVTGADVERVAEALFRHEWAKAPTLAPSWLAESHSPELRAYWIECARAAIDALAAREEAGE